MRTNDFNQNTLISVDQMMQEMMESVMPGDLMVLADSAANMMLDQTRQMMGNLVGYKELMMQYACAIKEIRTKFDVLSTECRIRYQRNPISSINTRLKRTASLTEKLSRRNLPFITHEFICEGKVKIPKPVNDIPGRAGNGIRIRVIFT